ncbi:hypothetical protein BSKO_03543 [Bryopsis sp. KO-2023]|nr:hypothetical protein BSKO_03543 [Bryopsis sp. KO-2023]
MNFGQLWDQLVDCICRPPRDRYTEDDLIGGEGKRFAIGTFEGIREDLELVNGKGQKLQCSHFKPLHAVDETLPCVIYCHCNSGSRRDAEEGVILLVPQGISVFCMDFAGSGLSDGDWVSLGAREVEDLDAIVEHLRKEGKTSKIGLWGRSMGAVTALLYCKRDPSMAGVVLDSPFSKLTDLMLELVQDQQVPIPKAFVRVALAAMRRSVRKRAGFDIYQVAPLDSVGEAFVPVLFGHANGDTFVKKAHSEKLHEKYAGDKNIITFDGDHNSRRPQFFYHSASIFFHNVLQPTFVHKQAPSQPEPDMSLASSRLNQLRLDTGRGAEHIAGETNVPWNPSWAGRSPTSADFDEMLWAASARGEREDDSEQSSSLAEESWEDLWRTPQNQQDPSTAPAASGNGWYGLLPDTADAEQLMIQAALKASLEDAVERSAAGEASSPSEDGARPDSPDTRHGPTGGGGDSLQRRRSESEMIANQVDLLHQELGATLSTELPAERHQGNEPGGSLLN